MHTHSLARILPWLPEHGVEVNGVAALMALQRARVHAAAANTAALAAEKAQGLRMNVRTLTTVFRLVFTRQKRC